MQLLENIEHSCSNRPPFGTVFVIYLLILHHNKVFRLGFKNNKFVIIPFEMFISRVTNKL